MRKTGTREWSEHSINVCRGCAHGCLYCYARASALRDGILTKGESWTNEVVRADAATRKYPLYKGRVMFPTMHDITTGNAGACLAALISLLQAGNDVLVVSKAAGHVPVLLEAVRRTVSVIPHTPMELRVSLTCLDPAIARFWEPNAPSPGQRIDALEKAATLGIPTSVSVEPLLEPERVEDLVSEARAVGVEGEIWIGCANKLRERTAWCLYHLGHRLEDEIDRIERWQTQGAMEKIFAALKDYPQIRWKDSYQKALGIDATGRPA